MPTIRSQFRQSGIIGCLHKYRSVVIDVLKLKINKLVSLDKNHNNFIVKEHRLTKINYVIILFNYRTFVLPKMNTNKTEKRGTIIQSYMIDYKCQFSSLPCHQVFTSFVSLSCDIWLQDSSLIAQSLYLLFTYRIPEQLSYINTV